MLAYMRAEDVLTKTTAQLQKLKHDRKTLPSLSFYEQFRFFWPHREHLRVNRFPWTCDLRVTEFSQISKRSKYYRNERGHERNPRIIIMLPAYFMNVAFLVRTATFLPTSVRRSPRTKPRRNETTSAPSQLVYLMTPTAAFAFTARSIFI
ncbi:hypothetical protein BaRGS_00032003 [Batillaria attramentaria]|uniref:Uncharacterized protein n=1 Tax=Batillaria attramentaria TaxID=370345 RepID=A0ABD0JPW9_9CAEN